MTARRRHRGSKPHTPKARRASRPQSHEVGAKRFIPALGVVGLLVIHWTLASTSIRHKCCTFDEVAHLTKGYAWWHLDDKRLTPDHPPLAQAWAALPLLTDGLRFPALDQQAWYHSATFTLGKQFFYRMGNDPDAMLRQARRMVLLLSLATAVVVYLWSRKLFGTAGGFVALILYVLSPTMLGHSRLVTTDMCVSLFFLLAIGSVWWVLHEITPMSLLAGAAALAGLFSSKFSAVLIIPVGLALTVIRLLSGRPLRVRLGKERQVSRRWKMAAIFVSVMAAYVLAVGLSLWAAFGFRYDAMIVEEPGRDRFFTPDSLPEGKTVWEHQGRGIPRTAAAIDWARQRRILPEAYLYGFLYTMQGARGRDAFLDGQRRKTGWWYFFPLCFLYKVPIPIMVVIVAAAVFLVARKGTCGTSEEKAGSPPGRRLATTLYRTAPLWVFIVVYWAFALNSHLNIGHRHLLPTFAPMFVLCGASAGWMYASRKWVRAIVPAFLCLLAAASLSTWPDYLAYFNIIGGGSAKGYRHLVDSSLDWGQDLPGLKRWLDKTRNGQRVYLAYFGTGNSRHYGLNVSPLPSYLRKSGRGDYRLQGGLYCISATRLQQVYMLKTSDWTADLERRYRRDLEEMRRFEETSDEDATRGPLLKSKGKGFKSRFDTFQELRFGRLCAYLRKREPDDHVGHSILIYCLTDEQVNDALYGPVP